jgi:hypothetical protein
LKYGDEGVKDSVVNGEKTLACAAREIMEKRCGVVKHTLRKNRTRIKKSALVIDEQQSKDYGALHFSMVAIGNINLIDIGDPFFNLAIDNVINFANSRKTKGEK